ncbi:MAG: hypothetical protein J1E61_08800 [Lachnospiraceae bacterium]|nr:hypothetical protein [Lachnospiraceae bacterium]
MNSKKAETILFSVWWSRFLIVPLWLIILVYYLFHMPFHPVVRFLEAIFLYVLPFALVFIIRHVINMIVHDYCCIGAYTNYLKKISKKSKKANIHLQLFWVYGLMGMKDESGRQLEVLEGMKEKLKGVNRIFFHLYKAGYLRSLEDKEGCRQELHQAEREMENHKEIKGKRREEFLNAISIYGYLNDEKWEEAIELLKENRSGSILSCSVNAYHLGKCYMETGKTELAYKEFAFTAKWGGDASCAIEARRIMENAPSVHPEGESKAKFIYKNKAIKIALIMVIWLASIISLHYSTSIGSTVKESYCNNFNIHKEDAIRVLYEKETGENVIAIILEDERFQYCYFKLKNTQSGKVYKLTDVYTQPCEGKEELLSFYSTVEGLEEVEPVVRFNVESQVYFVITLFYRGKDVPSNALDEFAGILYDYPVGRLMIDGNEAWLESIEINGKPAYLWKVPCIPAKIKHQYVSVEIVDG